MIEDQIANIQIFHNAIQLLQLWLRIEIPFADNAKSLEEILQPLQYGGYLSFTVSIGYLFSHSSVK